MFVRLFKDRTLVSHITFMTMNLHIVREMYNADLDEVFGISEACGFFTWKREDYKRELVRTDSVTLVAVSESKDNKEDYGIDGFLIARLITPEAELLNIAVRDYCRKNGVGTLLFQEFMNECERKKIESVWLEVRESNTAAISFYLSKGFKKAGKRTSYYNNPVEDAILMSLKFFL